MPPWDEMIRECLRQQDLVSDEVVGEVLWKIKSLERI